MDFMYTMAFHEGRFLWLKVLKMEACHSQYNLPATQHTIDPCLNKMQFVLKSLSKHNQYMGITNPRLNICNYEILPIYCCMEIKHIHESIFELIFHSFRTCII